MAIQRTHRLLGRDDLRFIGDARDPGRYEGVSADAFVCSEVLEHIKDDLAIVSLWKSGQFCVCSLPSFEAENHVRVMQSERDIQDRYGNLIDIKGTLKVKNLSFRSIVEELLPGTALEPVQA